MRDGDVVVTNHFINIFININRPFGLTIIWVRHVKIIMIILLNETLNETES